MWTITRVEDVFREVRQAARVLRRTPGHSIAVITLLALGIGANAAMFSLVNALFIRELPVYEPERLVAVSPGWPTALLDDFRRAQTSFSSILANGSVGATVLSTPAGEQLAGVSGGTVSGNYFQVLGVQAALGRVFTEADDSPGDPQPVLVISHAFWRRQFGGDPNALGQRILLAGTPFSIIGIAPAAFTGISPGVARDFWVPLHALFVTVPEGDARRRRSYPWLSTIARLKPGVSVMQAQAESEAVYSQIAPPPTQPEGNRRSRVRVEPASRGSGGIRGQLTTPIQILAGTVIVVLLVVWANVATLLLARGAARQREMAVRQALGCSRLRLMRQLLLEGLLLAGAGGAIGIVLAPNAARALLAMQPSFGRLDLDLSLEQNTLLFGLGISLLTALAFSVAPALRASAAKIGTALKSSSGGQIGRQKLIRAVIAVQVALSVVLVAASFLFTRSLLGLHTMDTGFDREHLLSAIVDAAPAGYRDGASQALLGERLVERLSGVPGVKSASVGLCAVVMGCSRASVVNFEGRTSRPDDPSIWINPVSPNYFETVGIPLVMGRGFGPQDHAGSPHVAVVTDALARFYFPGQNALGKRYIERDGGEAVEIVGVARDVKFVSPRDAPIRMAFLSRSQSPGSIGYVQVRTEGSPEALVTPVRRAILEVEPKISLRGPDPLSRVLEQILSRDMLLSRASALFGFIALLLACFGIYGVISYFVAARSAEFGIRLALGAQPRAIMRHIIAEALKTVLPGTIAGIGAAWAAGRLVESLLFGITGRDLLTHAGVAITLLLTTIAAAYVPALRASRIDPLRTLRAE
ncbi:MAG: ABC transporter permease [Candidatus Solibacter sp.]